MAVLPGPVAPGAEAEPATDGGAVPAAALSAARRGARLAAGSGVVNQLLSVLATVALLRLLHPREIGLVTTTNMVMALLALATQVGLAPRLVQRSRLDQGIASTAFWSAAGIGAGLAAVGIAAAPYLARAFGQPATTGFIMALCPTAGFRVMAAVPRAMLLRSFRFRRIYAVEVGAMAAYVATQVSLAVAGFGAWSIIAGQALYATALLFGMMAAAGWLPSFTFSLVTAREDLAFNGSVLSASGLGYVALNADYWTVSRTMGAAALAVYYVAYVLPDLLRQRLGAVATDVLLPVLSRSDPDALARRYLRAVRLGAAVAFPCAAGLAAVSGDVTRVFFGPRYAGSAGAMRLICLMTAFEVVTSAGTTALLARGAAHRVLAVQAVRVAALAGGLAIVAPTHRLTAVAGAVVVAAAIAWLVMLLTVRGTAGVPLRAVGSAVAPSAAAALAMAGAVAALRLGMPAVPRPLALGGCVVAGAVAYPVLLRLAAPATYAELRAEAARAWPAALRPRRGAVVAP